MYSMIPTIENAMRMLFLQARDWQIGNLRGMRLLLHSLMSLTSTNKLAEGEEIHVS